MNVVSCPPPTPQLQLDTLFHLNPTRRILSTREPQPPPGPSFILIRGATSCAWAIHANIPDPLADALNTLAAQEPPSSVWTDPPLHALRYQALLTGQVHSGPAFAFPSHLDSPADAIPIHDEAPLHHHF